MSSDAVTWAKAQKCPSPRAKAVLICLAAYADAEGCAFAAVSTLVLETELEERTVQRGLADLRRGDAERCIAPLLEDTGDKRLWKGKLIPIYRFPLERGPQNTRERMDLERALGVTPVSPQGFSGDTDGAPRGDMGDELGVTRVSPPILRDQDNSQGNAQHGAREAALRPVFDDLVGAISKRVLKFADLGEAWNAFVRLDRAGVDVAMLPDCARRMNVDPDFRSRRYPPTLEVWLDKGQWRAWLPEPELALAEPDAPVVHPAWERLRAELRLTIDPGQFGSYLAPATYIEADGRGYLVALTDIGRRWIADHCWARIAKGLADADVGVEDLRLTCKQEFEAQLRQGVK